jgi:putative flippase GtrA
MPRAGFLPQLLWYLVVAVVAAAVDTGLLWLLVSRAGVHYTVAAALSFTAGLLVNFALARTFVFQASRLGFWAELSSYAIIGVAGVLLTELILFLSFGLVGLPLLLSKAIALVLVFFWNFLARRRLVYQDSTR